jgi:hypothetical protein
MSPLSVHRVDGGGSKLPAQSPRRRPRASASTVAAVTDLAVLHGPAGPDHSLAEIAPTAPALGDGTSIGVMIAHHAADGLGPDRRREALTRGLSAALRLPSCVLALLTALRRVHAPEPHALAGDAEGIAVGDHGAAVTSKIIGPSFNLICLRRDPSSVEQLRSFRSD